MIYFVTVDITNVGGIERSLSTLGSELAAQGQSVTVVSCFKNNHRPKFFFPGVKIKYLIDGHADFIGDGIVLKIFNYAKCFICLARFFGQSKSGKVISVYPMLSVLLTFILNQKVHKLYGWEHSQYAGHSRILNILRKLRYRRLKTLFVLTDLERRYYVKYGVDIHVLPNPVELVSFNKRTRKDPRIIFVGRMSSEKSPEKFLHIISAFKNQFGDRFSAKMYGAGELASRVKTLINELGLGSNVGLITDCTNQEIIYDADVLVSTSRTEVFGIALVEAMGHGLITFASNICNGPKFLIKNGENGFLVEIDDVSSVASLMTEVLNDRRVSLLVSRSARETFMHYSAPVIAKRLLDYIYE